MTKKELDDFVNSMSHQQYMKLQEFFENMPRVRYKTKVKNELKDLVDKLEKNVV